MQLANATTAAAVTAVAAVAILVVFHRRRRKEVPSPSLPNAEAPSPSLPSATYGDVTVRPASSADLAHLAAVSETSGQQIVPGGGDFVLNAWDEWWTMDPRLHWNDFAFVDDRAVAFARVEAYGPVGAPESGWLMAMRVRPEFQGQRVMARLQAHLLARLPDGVCAHLYLAVGSANEKMRRVCEPRHAFYGTYVLHSFMPSAMLRADRERYAAALSIGPLAPSDHDAAWAFVCACVEASPELLLPGRYYDFRAPTRCALDDKIHSGRAVAARDGGTIVALFFQFDNDMPDGQGVRRIFTCCAAASLEPAKLGSVFLAFGKAQPTTDAASGAALRTQLSVGPCIDKDGRDVQPRTTIALTAGNYTRPRSTHLRVYRVQ
jgi:GNAT superfamily N-acetyltransferase